MKEEDEMPKTKEIDISNLEDPADRDQNSSASIAPGSAS